MLEIAVILGVLAFVFFMVWLVFIISESPSFWKGLFSFIVMALLIAGCIYGIISIGNHDPQNALKKMDTTIEYAQVTTIATNKICLDNVCYKMINNAVTEKYPIDLSKYKIGDVVKYQKIIGDFDNYLIEITKVAEAQ